METKLLKFVINMSKCAIYGIIAMSTLFSAFALDGEAQKKSLEEISIHLEIENLKLYKAFRAIEDASEFQFAYKKSELPDYNPNFMKSKQDNKIYLKLSSSTKGKLCHNTQLFKEELYNYYVNFFNIFFL